MNDHTLKVGKKIIITILISTLLLQLCTGCWDRRELEERIAAIGIAIDQVEDSEGGQPMFTVTVQIPIPIRIAGGMNGGGEGGMNSVRVISSTGFTVAQALSNLQKRLNQQLFLGHTRVIVVSEKVARQGLSEPLDGFRRDPSLRRLLWFVVVDGQARELLQVDARLEQIPIVYVMTLIENGTKKEMIPDITLGQFYICETHSGKQPLLNYLLPRKDDVAWMGVALFDGDKMIGKLDSKKTWMLMQLKNDGYGGDFLIYPDKRDEHKHFVIRPKQLRTKLRSKVNHGKISAHYRVYIQADLLEENLGYDLSSPGRLEHLERKAERALEKEASLVIKLLQKKYKVDSLDLGAKMKAHHYDEWQKMNWEEEFPNVEITVEYRVELRRIGMKMK